MVTGITEDMVVLDANHPMAGQTLKFEIEMIEII
jgi:FKBP-type peptidyl-prolyl cis-trans isomerase 2